MEFASHFPGKPGGSRTTVPETTLVQECLAAALRVYALTAAAAGEVTVFSLYAIVTSTFSEPPSL
jgi:hypothetical protein